MTNQPRHVRKYRDTKLWRSMAATIAVVLVVAGIPSAATATPEVNNFDYGVDCTEAWLYPGRALTNGDHINMDVVIDGVKQQRNAYVDSNIAGGYNGLGIRINGFDPIPLTETQVKTGNFHFKYSNYISENSYTVEWVQFNSAYFNQDRDPSKFIECGSTPPPPELCVPEYEWVKESTESLYEHRVEVLKDQVTYKKQERVRTWKPGKDEFKEYRTQTRAWLQPSEHKQVKTTWRFGGDGVTNINGVAVPGKWTNSGGSASWYELPSAVTNAVWGPSGPPSNIVPPSSSESNPSTGSVPLSTYGAPSSAGSVQYRAWLVPEGEWSGWSNWSGWSSTNPGQETNTMRVESRVTQEAIPGSWSNWGNWSWVNPHQVTEWLDAPVTEIDMPGGPWAIGVPKFIGNDESKEYQYIEYKTQQVHASWDVSEPEWFETGEQPAGWTLVDSEESRTVVVDGPVWSVESPGDGWTKTGKERKADCLVTPPSFNPGTCLATGTVDAPETDVYSWNVTGPANARLYTAVAKGENILSGQLVYGPYDTTQTSWKADECQPVFEAEQWCGYVKIEYTNNSKWTRYPDYSFTGDTKTPTDFGSGLTWNTVKVEPGESVVIFEKYFDEDYHDGGPIDVWYQDILGAERDIDATKVTLVVDTDCDPNETTPVEPDVEVTESICVQGEPSEPSVTVTVPSTPGVKYLLGGEDVTGTTVVSHEDVTITANPLEWFVFSDTAISEWTYKVPTELAQDCDVLASGEIGSVCVGEVPYLAYDVVLPEGFVPDSDTPLTVTFQNPNGDDHVVAGLDLEGWITWPGASEGIPNQWPGWELVDGKYVNVGDDNFGWTRDNVTVKFDAGPVFLTTVEYPESTSECGNPPPAPPEEPRGQFAVTGLKFVDPAPICEARLKDNTDFGQVIVPESDDVVFLNGEGDVLKPGTHKITSAKSATYTAEAVDKDGPVLVGDTKWTHTLKSPELKGDCGELATTGMDRGLMYSLAIIAGLLLFAGMHIVTLSRSRKRGNETAVIAG